MLNLGTQVLKKIQNLLTQIDRPSKLKKKRASQQNQHGRKKDKQNSCNQRIERLYKDHLRKKIKTHQINKQKTIAQLFENKHFKVENKHSIFLNQQKKRKPIYERTQEIILQRQKSIEKIRQSMPGKSKQEMEELQMQEILKNQIQLSRRYTKQEFNQKMMEMEKRNMKRIEKLNQQKLDCLYENQKKFMEKPVISKGSVKIWKEKQLKKNLSSNVLQRFQQYDFQRKKNWDQFIRIRKNQQTPFTPRLTQTTRCIAERSRSKSSIFQNISRSLSCKCLNRQSNTGNISSRSKQKLGGSTGINTSRSRQLLSSRKWQKN